LLPLIALPAIVCVVLAHVKDRIAHIGRREDETTVANANHPD